MLTIAPPTKAARVPDHRSVRATMDLGPCYAAVPGLDAVPRALQRRDYGNGSACTEGAVTSCSNSSANCWLSAIAMRQARMRASASSP